MVVENGGMTIDQALKIKPMDIAERLGGIPDRKFPLFRLGGPGIPKSS